MIDGLANINQTVVPCVKGDLISESIEVDPATEIQNCE